MAFVSTASAVSRLSVLARYQAERDATGGGRYVDNPDRSHPRVLATAAMIDQDRVADMVTVYSRSGAAVPRPERSYPPEQSPVS
jgi:hypothetical protein